MPRSHGRTVAVVSHRYWPLFDLRLTTPDLELRVATEADQLRLADVLPVDVETDPSLPTYDLGDARASRGAATFQGYWRAFGSWRPESWAVPFVVIRDGELIGEQVLEGDDFARLRTVDSYSMLVSEARGKGYGKQMRDAVLAFAFEQLEAACAITSAWHDNHASLGVSRALGYLPNGERRQRRGDGVDTMVHLRLTREDWLARADRPPVEITGFEPCRPLFGL
jgi:RimJ/RimL family protein N-acetyltransferase